MSTDTDLHTLRVEVARGCRILANTGLVDGILGHISVRVDTDRLLVRCRGPQENGLIFTIPEDIKLVDLDGHGELTDYASPNEFPLHAEVLRTRPEVMAVVHAHPPGVVTADLAGVPLRPVIGAFNIPAARLAAEGIPIYQRSVLISQRKLAIDMLTAMGAHPICLLRGHGLTSTGTSLSQAVARALAVEQLAQLCLRVTQTGRPLQELPADDLAQLPDLGARFNDTLLWNYQTARLAAQGLDIPSTTSDAPMQRSSAEQERDFIR